MGIQNDMQEIDWAATFQVGIWTRRSYSYGINFSESENCNCHRYGRLQHDEGKNITDTSFRRRQIHSRIPSIGAKIKGESLT